MLIVPTAQSAASPDGPLRTIHSHLRLYEASKLVVRPGNHGATRANEDGSLGEKKSAPGVRHDHVGFIDLLLDQSRCGADATATVSGRSPCATHHAGNTSERVWLLYPLIQLDQ